MDKMLFFVLLVFGLLLCQLTFSQGNSGDWGEWTDVSQCTARPCNCSKKDWVVDETECKEGKVLQVRGCKGDTCQYEGMTGTIRKAKCYNLNKYCPGWSDWMAVNECECKVNETKGVQPFMRTCTNPPPMFGDLECVINDKEEGLKDGNLFDCTCTEEEETWPTTEGTTTPSPKMPQCECKNNSSPYYQINLPTNGSFPKKASNSDKTTTTTQGPTKYTFGINIDYNDYNDFDNTELCICNGNETLAGGGSTETSTSTYT